MNVRGAMDAFWKVLLMSVIILGPGQVAAAAERELVSATVESVDVAARRIVAGGTEYALSSTVAISWQGGVAVNLGEVTPGTRVRMELEDGTASGRPVVRRMTLQVD
jgi:hypothetical protein